MKFLGFELPGVNLEKGTLAEQLEAKKVQLEKLQSALERASSFKERTDVEIRAKLRSTMRLQAEIDGINEEIKELEGAIANTN